jgi:precorrin-6Y C5,15-methyltransferase (decarboxylating)
MQRFIVIGITDNPQPFFPPEVLEIIRNGKVFSGGKRHHEIVAPLLPADTEWIDITIPLDAVFKRYHDEVVIFASGDPLFFGFANTLRREFPDAAITIYPSFNSLQMLAHRLVMPYHDMRIVSLTGRPWSEFDRALIERVEKIGVLTDKEHTPAAIAQRMLDYGYTNYTMHVGEHLGNPTFEKVITIFLEEAAHRDFSMPNCVILCPACCDGVTAATPFGIPDCEFTLLDGREKMITKMPIRLLTLQALALPKRHVFWDIGFCTGSISIEARLQFPQLHIEAFEIRPECEAIIHENARRLGTPGISVHIGDFLKTDIASFPRPDAVFIGGHGGKLKEMIAKVLTVLADDGVIVMNSVKAPKVLTDSQQLWDETCEEFGLRQEPPMKIVIDEHHPIKILKCRK